jgi:hypothetical protein
MPYHLATPQFVTPNRKLPATRFERVTIRV